MRMVRFFGISSHDDSDITGVALDAAIGVLAGLALVLAIWLLADALGPQVAHAATAGIPVTSRAAP